MSSQAKQGAGTGSEVGARHATVWAAVVEAVIQADGDLDSPTRTAVASAAAESGAVSNGVTPHTVASSLQAELVPYVRKVAVHAYRVLDRDVEELLEAGYSQDAVLETTLAAALGAGQARLDAGLAAIGQGW